MESSLWHKFTNPVYKFHSEECFSYETYKIDVNFIHKSGASRKKSVLIAFEKNILSQNTWNIRTHCNFHHAKLSTDSVLLLTAHER